MKTARLSTVCLLALAILAAGAVVAETRISIDTRERTLTVIENGQVVHSFENISVGRAGVTREKIADDDKTPLGTYRVRRVKRDSPYHLYFGLDYPSPEQAARASATGLIGAADYQAILRAHQRGEEPPPDTALGGNIGIHGIGRGDPLIHQKLNWTEGCVALTDEQIDELARWIRLQTEGVGPRRSHLPGSREPAKDQRKGKNK
jgi:murein L,D-transpeptidase YafK